jgi:hypothetical protein
MGDDDFDRQALEQAEFQDLTDGQMSGPDNARYAERLRETNRRDEHPNEYATAVEEDVKAAVKEVEGRALAKERTEQRYGAWLSRAKEHGTTVPDYLDRVYSIEQTLRRDPIAGLSVIARNIGLSPQQVLTGLAGTLKVDQITGQMDGGVPAAREAQSTHEIESIVRMAEERLPGFADLQGRIAEIIRDPRFPRSGHSADGYGHDLMQAYKMAAYEASQKREAQDVETARRASRSIGGGRGSGGSHGMRVEDGPRHSQPRDERGRYEAELLDDVRRAVEQVRG